jgi:hypothetical protein
MVETIKKRLEIPAEFRCSITGLIMVDPVSTSDGHVYERESIEEWLKDHNTSPLTGKNLEHKKLVPNLFARNTIQKYLGNSIVF